MVTAGINRSRLFWLAVLALFTAAASASIRAAIASSLKAEWIDPIAPLQAGELIGSALGSAFLGFAVTLDPARTLLPGTAGDFSWGGMASTYFWIDPREELIVIFMTQLMPSATYPLRRELRTLVYSAFE